MITKDLQSFLDTCIAISDQPRHVFEYDGFEAASGMAEDAILHAVRALCDAGYAEYAHYNASSGDVDMGFYLLHKGLHYKQYQRLATAQRWKERLWGFLTGVAITVLAWLLTK
ncbi:MAG: hypothetical protein PHI98_16870 [Eubacteriales bacterium]|nr:hypothetical protein [Eubacteriales bacterium]